VLPDLFGSILVPSQVIQELGVSVICTIGVLVEAHLNSLLDFDAAIHVLSNTTFRLHTNIVSTARARIFALQPEYGSKHDLEKL